MTTFQQKIMKHYLDKGVLRLILYLLITPFQKLYFSIYRTINAYNYIYKYSTESKKLQADEKVDFFSYSTVDSIPDSLKEYIANETSSGRLNSYLIGVKHYGCQLWVAHYNSEPACFSLSRKASAIPYWFIPLNPRAVVFLINFTIERFRGLSLSPLLAQHMAEKFVAEDRDVYSDCKVYNKASIRSMEKSGFEVIAKKRPISEKWSKTLEDE